MFSFEPPKPIRKGIYLCSNKYVLEPLIPLYQEDHETFGVLIVSGKEALFYKINNYECNLLQKESLQLLKKHKKGGQSAARFGRMADSKREHTVDYVMEIFWNLFYVADGNHLNVKGVIVAGPAEMKKDLVATDLFQKYFADNLICCKSLNQIDETTIHTLFKEAQEEILQTKITEEKAMLDSVLDLQITDPDLLAFGIKEIREKLTEGLLKNVIGVKDGVTAELDLVKQLIPESGAELVLLETQAVGSRVTQEYGGWLGVQWFSY